jgi:P4 family phage/plasmid primase-like protien
VSKEYRSEDGNGRGNPATMQAATQYMRAGVCVIPIPVGRKSPARSGWQNERWTLADVSELWSGGEGVGALWGVPSGGLVDLDLDWSEARIAADHILPRTRTFGRPGAPESHRVYRVTDKIPKSKKYKLPGDGSGRCVLEVLSTGAQSLLPPSLHESGELRMWYQLHRAAELSARELMEGAADSASAALIARSWPGQGARHDFVLAASGYVGRHLPRERAARVMEAAILASSDEEARGRLTDVSDTLEALDAGRPATGGPTLETLAPGVAWQLQRWHGWRSGGHQESKSKGSEATPTDDELRDRFRQSHPDYGYGLGAWRRYSEGIWEGVEEVVVKDGVCRILEAAKEEDIRPTRALMNSVAELLRVRVAVPDRVWDADPNVLVCTNGALDLRTRELKPHAKEHYATAGVPYCYDEDAGSASWELVMRDVVAANLGDEATVFLQEFCGYCLTPDTEHEIALWLTGKHGGGRSTILAGLQAMLGPKAGVLSLSDIARSSFALTNLPGKTLVTATEQPAVYLRGGGVLNAIISGEPIQVDRKYLPPIEVTPRCKIAWALNELPRVGNMDDGIFRRVKIMELPEIPAEERDPRVKESVKGSGAAILIWALDGLERLRRRGYFEIPESIASATEEFIEHNDVPRLFVDEECEEGPEFWEGSSALYEGYRFWCLDNGHKPLSKTSAAKEWKRLGFESRRGAKGVRWHGVKLSSVGASEYHRPDGGTR